MACRRKACGASRIHLRALVRVRSSWALRMALRIVDMTMAHLVCTGPGTVLMDRNGFSSQSVDVLPASAGQREGAYKGAGHLGVELVNQLPPLARWTSSSSLPGCSGEAVEGSLLLTTGWLAPVFLALTR